MQFFTARVRDQPDSEQRQRVYLAALAAHSKLVEIVEGRFQARTVSCHTCGTQRRS
ncbi:hypothetical protein AB0J74_09105 [Asanoa sp. NPDC049573]|uniref:hypothetical protein n=1 Tax=Asanoa sp. NPDC049573 TaxID=3155396 RepID=UPI00342E6340